MSINHSYTSSKRIILIEYQKKKVKVYTRVDIIQPSSHKEIMEVKFLIQLILILKEDNKYNYL